METVRTVGVNQIRLLGAVVADVKKRVMLSMFRARK